MRSLALLLASSLLMPPALPASEFDWLVREFSRESGAKAMHIPFLGLARFVVAAGHPAGTSELRLAVFEHANLESVRFSQLTDEMVGSAWKLIVRVRSRNGESTNIYLHSEGEHLRVLVTTLAHDDATFVQVRIQPERLMQFVDEHRTIR
jgi:hypothetical protein